MTFLPPTNLFWILADLLQILVILVLVEVVVSWGVMMGNISPYKPWVRTLKRVTDPLLEPIRRLVPPHKLRGIDISPLILIIAINILQRVLYSLGASG